MKKTSNVLWGLVFVVVGIIIALNSLGIADINIFFDGWWTLFIIVPSFIDLIKGGNRTGSIIGLVIGVALLLCCQDFLRFDIILKLIIPFILVIIGISLIFKNIFDFEIKGQIKKLNEKIKKDSDYCATFGNQNVKFDGEEFNGCIVNSVFGSVKLDLRDSIIKEDVIINGTCIFGGIEILIPDNVRVKIKSTPIFGGVDDKTKSSVDKKSKTIFVNATCIFGGIEIK